MKNFFEKFLGALAAAWEKLIDFPLPGKLQNLVPSEKSTEFELASFPLLGWLAGAVISGCAVLVSWIFNTYVGAFIFALLAWLFMTLRDSGRGDGAVTVLVASRLPEDSIPWRIVVPVAAEILKFALLMMIFCRGNAMILAVILGGAFAMEAILAADAEFDPPLLDNSSEAKNKLWIMLGVLGGISFIIDHFTTVVATLVFIVTWRQFAIRAEKNGLNVGQISFAGSVMSWILLISMGIVI